ncbi:hypothetical protein SANTM175S_09035 [Streptomyces antimycoticus]
MAGCGPACSSCSRSAALGPSTNQRRGTDHAAARPARGRDTTTTHGTCWAVWRVTAANYSHATAAAKRRRLKAIESLIKSLQGEPMLLSLCPQVDPAQVVRDMTAGIDLEASDRYVDLAHTVLDQLETMELTGRTDWLAIPLPSESRRGTLTQVLSAARAELAGQLGLMPAPISATEEQRRTDQAAPDPGPMAGRRSDAASHRVRDPVDLRPQCPPWPGLLAARPGRQRAPGPGRGRTTAALSESLLAEGGTDFGSRRGRPTGNPFHRRFLQVSTEWETATRRCSPWPRCPRNSPSPAASTSRRSTNSPSRSNRGCPPPHHPRAQGRSQIAAPGTGAGPPGSRVRRRCRRRAGPCPHRHRQARSLPLEGDLLRA